MRHRRNSLSSVRPDRNRSQINSSLELFKSFFEHGVVGFSITDHTGQLLEVNPAFCSITGYSEAELRGIGNESAFTHPEDAGSSVERIASLINSNRPGLVEEKRYLRKNGEIVWVQNSVSLTRDDEQRCYLVRLTQDITERKRAEEAALIYSRRLIEAQEAERGRLSRELHDQVGQTLTAVKMNLHLLQRKCSNPETLASIDRNIEVIDVAVDQVRDLSVALRPLLLDDFGLVVALRWYLERRARDCGLCADLSSSSLTDNDRFSSELETACFRIVQEAVDNVIKHALAGRIGVMLERYGSDLILLVVDDGVGFDPTSLPGGHGIRGMKERAQAVGGSVTIESMPERGTEVCARFPTQEAAPTSTPEESRLTSFAKRVSSVSSA